MYGNTENHTAQYCKTIPNESSGMYWLETANMAVSIFWLVFVQMGIDCPAPFSLFCVCVYVLFYVGFLFFYFLGGFWVLLLRVFLVDI